MKIEFLEPRVLLTGAFTTYDAGLKKLTVNATSGADTIVISLSGGNTLSVSVNSVNDYNLGSANSAAVLTLIEVQGNGGNDSINLGTTTKAIITQTVINGGSGSDTITGGAGPDEIYGSSGNDSIDGNLGADTISGGGDNDTVSYVTRGTGVNVNLDLLANDGASGEGDWVGAGTTDVESIMGGLGNDTLTGNNSGNYISGNSGADAIYGSAGSDTIVGGAGGDSLYGNDDSDFIFSRDGEFDVINGGPGIDSADVDTSPVEAPLPGAVPLAKPRATSPFSTRRVGMRPRASGVLTAAAPLPAPPPGDDVEETIDAATLPSILQTLDPYCVGQVLVVRDKQGTLNVGGTSGDDTFAIKSLAGTEEVQVSNNGGITNWPVLSNPVNINGTGGIDAIDISGGNVQYRPGSAVGTVANSDGHAINFNGVIPTGGPTFSNVAALTVVTPGSSDSIQLAQSPDGISMVGGSSDGAAFGPIALGGVQLLKLDIGTNNLAPSSDTVTANDFGPNSPPVAILTSSASPGPVSLVINSGVLNLANDPAADPTAGQFTAEVADGGALRFHAPITHVNTLSLQGGAQIAPGASHVLVVRNLNLIGNGTLDLADNTLIHSPPNGAPPSQLGALVMASHQNGWNGPGLASNLAASDSRRAIAFADAARLFGPGGGVFRGVNVGPGDAIATVTLRGDSNLDGNVDFPDLVTVAQHYGQPADGGWLSGDNNYDGTVDFQDLVAVAQNYGLPPALP